ncbi:hypothetical protein AB0O47_39545 [Streptomyces noursei]|uniref:hypothetical protein n=1 Tax=Streptomyces noursei TaxID=1971 RepID=UPI00344D35C1
MPKKTAAKDKKAGKLRGSALHNETGTTICPNSDCGATVSTINGRFSCHCGYNSRD